VLTMKVLLLVCLSLLAVVSLGLGDALTDKHEELSLKALEATEIKDNFAGISSVRNAREAKKDEQKKKRKAKRKEKKKRKQNKIKKNKSKNGKTRKEKGKRKNKGKNRKAKKKTKNTKRKKRKQNKNKNKKKSSASRKKARKNIKKRNKKKKQQKARKARKNKKKGKKNTTRKKIKHTSRKRKTKQARRKNKQGRQQRQTTCGTSQVNDTCLNNAVNALNFEKNQIQNFFKQKTRVTNHNKTKSNKLGKKGEFEDAAKYLLQALGGDINNPTCGESGTAQKARSAKSAKENYNLLLNCSESIKEACTMPKMTFNATVKEKMDKCAFIFNKSKTAANDCRTNKAYLSNGTAACSCWSKAAIGITEAKKEGCSAESTAKAVKKAKQKCIAAFGKCKKAEDAAVGLIHTCMAGEVKNISATGRW